MTSDSDQVRGDTPDLNTDRETATQTTQGGPNVSHTVSGPNSPSPKGHCQITDKTEKDWWDKAKPFVEIPGLILLAVYTLYTIKMYGANKKSADAAKSSADTAANQLELAERPWVDANVSIDGPLTYNVNGANLTFLINMRNSGHSPAVNTSISPKLIMTFGQTDAMPLRQHLCADAERQVRTLAFGTTLFPNVQFPDDMRLTLSDKEIKDAQAIWKGRLGNNIVGLNLVFCLAYRPTFTNTIYHTGYIFEIIELDRKTKLPGITFPYGQEIDANHLRIRLGIGSIVAD